jgi:hypothetical protein
MRTRRRNRSLKHQKGGQADEKQLNGFHLHADIYHDFGRDIEYYINHQPFKNYKDEDEVVSFFKKSEEPERIITKRAERLVESTNFLKYCRTTDFDVYLKTCLTNLRNNDAVAILHDCGHTMATTFGAQNLITFGSVIDPSGKPSNIADNPIYFKPKENYLEIPLESYGFSPDKIKSVIIKDFSFNQTKKTFFTGCFFKTNDGTCIDAVSTNPIDCSLSPEKLKIINVTDLARSGFLTSIKKAEEVDDIHYNIGKTLGDAMLVASITPIINGKDNPFLKGEGGTWENTNTPPAVFILKTNDRLNHIRAFIKGVPSILETKKGMWEKTSTPRSKAETIVGKCEYLPANPTFGSVIECLTQQLANIKYYVPRRYLELINNFKAGLDGDKLKPEYSNFSGSPILVTDEERKRGGKLFKTIIACLEVLKDEVERVFNEKQLVQFSADIDELSQETVITKNLKILTEANELFLKLTPKRTKVLNSRGFVIDAPIIVLSTNTPITLFGQPFSKTLKINDYKEIFSLDYKVYKENRPPLDTSVIARDFFNYFRDKTNIEDFYVPDKFETQLREQPTAKRGRSSEETEQPNKRTKSSNKVYVSDNPTIDEKDTPYLASFLQFSKLYDWFTDGMFAIFSADALRCKRTEAQQGGGHSIGHVFLDLIVAEHMADEVQFLIDNNVINVELSQLEENTITDGICAINAFVCYINKHNSLVFGLDEKNDFVMKNPEESELYQYYDSRERAFMKIVTEMNTPEYLSNIRLPKRQIVRDGLTMERRAIPVGAKRRRTFRRKHSRRNKQ